MGWFWNKNNHQNYQNDTHNLNNQDQIYKQTSTHTYLSKKRSCQTDPNDQKYLICKTIIKDNNGTRQQQERVPANSQFGDLFTESSSFSNFNNFGSNGLQRQNMFSIFPSFFPQPNFIDFHNNPLKSNFTQNSNYKDDQGNQVHTYFNQYGKSQSCYQDPQNKEYMICKSKIFDGQETKQIQEKIKIGNNANIFGFGLPSFGRQFSTYGNQIDQQIQNMMRDMNQGFSTMMPLIGSIFGVMNNIDSLYNGNNLGDETQRKHRSQYTQNFPQNNYRNFKKQNNQNYFTTSGTKDTNVYDL